MHPHNIDLSPQPERSIILGCPILISLLYSLLAYFSFSCQTGYVRMCIIPLSNKQQCTNSQLKSVTNQSTV